MKKKWICPLILILSVLTATATAGDETGDAKALVDGFFNHMRGTASIALVDMTVHRPDWERTMTIKSWTQGVSDSVFTITAPAKDKGNGTLKKGVEMWTYNPKVNRVIKIPPSMMSQAWQGSDFSNNDLAKSDTIVNDYAHTIEGTETHEGKKVYVIKSIPKPEAPVVWGMLMFRVREDKILLSEEFFDEDLVSVKAMTTRDIQMLGDRLFPAVWRMQKTGAKDEYTRLDYRELEFKETLPPQLFTVSALKDLKR